MKIDELYPSRWIKASDLQGRQVNVVINKIVVEDLGDETKPVLYFRGKDRGLVLNRTNAGVIAAALGDETDGWMGHTITLFPAKVSFSGRLVDAVRVSIPAAKPAPTPAAVVSDEPPVEDDFPF